jgi:ankyrin repeat protein
LIVHRIGSAFAALRLRWIPLVLGGAACTGASAGEIHDAAAAGELGEVERLLSADPALLESSDRDGNTPLISACFAPPAFQPRVAVATFLMAHGANIKARNHWGGTPLYLALRSPELVQRFIDLGADVNTRAFGADGLTPLHQAVAIGEIRTARLLIAHGADVNATGVNGTPLDVAMGRPGGLAAAQLLLESGARLHRSSYGTTELHLAALAGSADIVRLLIEHGADVQARNDYQHTALYYAARHGRRRVAELLLKSGADPQDGAEAATLLVHETSSHRPCALRRSVVHSRSGRLRRAKRHRHLERSARGGDRPATQSARGPRRGAR